MKTQKNHMHDDTAAIDWTRLRLAASDAIDWGVDLAYEAIDPTHTADVLRVESTRSLLHAVIAGQTVKPRVGGLGDFLYTVGLVVGAIERDLGSSSGDDIAAAMIAALRTAMDPAQVSPIPTRAPSPHRCGRRHHGNAAPFGR